MTTTAVSLTRDQARWLSILAAAQLRGEARDTAVHRQHQLAWQALQAACQWDDET